MNERPSQHTSKSWCSELQPGQVSHILSLTSWSKASSQASKTEHPQSWLELGPATLAAMKQTEFARPRCKVTYAIGFEARKLEKLLKKQASARQGQHLLLD